MQIQKQSVILEKAVKKERKNNTHNIKSYKLKWFQVQRQWWKGVSYKSYTQNSLSLEIKDLAVQWTTD